MQLIFKKYQFNYGKQIWLAKNEKLSSCLHQYPHLKIIDELNVKMLKCLK
jgi:hypothetical protein